MSANSFGPARANFVEDMIHYDMLPPEVRKVVSDAPVNFKAGTILAVWRMHEFDGGTVKAFCAKLRRKMRAALAAARAGDQRQDGGERDG